MNTSISLSLLLIISLIFSSLMTVTMANPIYGSLQLIFTYVLISLFLLLHEAEFFTIAYLIIGAGGMGILFLFVVMTLPIVQKPEKIPKWNFFYISFIIPFLYELKPLFGFFDLTYLKTVNNTHTLNYLNTEWKATNISELGLALYAENTEIVYISAILLFVALLGAIILTANTKK